MNGETFIAPRNQRRNYEMETDLILHHEKNMSAPWPTPMREVEIKGFLWYLILKKHFHDLLSLQHFNTSIKKKIKNKLR